MIIGGGLQHAHAGGCVRRDRVRPVGVEPLGEFMQLFWPQRLGIVWIGGAVLRHDAPCLCVSVLSVYACHAYMSKTFIVLRAGSGLSVACCRSCAVGRSLSVACSIACMSGHTSRVKASVRQPSDVACALPRMSGHARADGYQGASPSVRDLRMVAYDITCATGRNISGNWAVGLLDNWAIR